MLDRKLKRKKKNLQLRRDAPVIFSLTYSHATFCLILTKTIRILHGSFITNYGGLAGLFFRMRHPFLLADHTNIRAK